MLRSCSRSVQRCAITVVLQTRTVCCGRSVSRSQSAAATAAGQNRVAGVAWVPSSQHRLRFGRRALATLTDEELRRKMEEFNDMFVTAREELEYAEESKDTTYFDEDAAGAKEAVEGAVALFEEILDSVEEDKRTDIMRSSGLRVEQLKAELDQVLVSDDH